MPAPRVCGSARASTARGTEWGAEGPGPQLSGVPVSQRGCARLYVMWERGCVPRRAVERSPRPAGRRLLLALRRSAGGSLRAAPPLPLPGGRPWRRRSSFRRRPPPALRVTSGLGPNAAAALSAQRRVCVQCRGGSRCRSPGP